MSSQIFWMKRRPTGIGITYENAKYSEEFEERYTLYLGMGWKAKGHHSEGVTYH
jgi:hypothetical protein